MSDIISSLLDGIGHQQHGRPDLAETIYQDVLSSDPLQPNALYLYGLLQLKDGRAAAAADLLDRAARLRPDAEIRLNLCRARLANGDYVAALWAADEVLLTSLPRSEALFLRGTALSGLGRSREALLALTEAARLNPDHAATWLNLGNAYADLDQLDQAECHVRAAIAIDATLIEAHASLGFILTSLGQLDAAIAACEAALALDSTSAEAHCNLATALLRSGDYARGFQEYEWHRLHRHFRDDMRDLPGRCWTGFPLEGQTLLVDAGQGLGDTIQLARYMPLLATLGATVVLACARPLIRFLTGQPGIAAVVPRGGDLPHYDCWVDQMSLPRLLGTLPDTIPGAAGYLSADLEQRRLWARRLPTARIGLVWAGNPRHHNDHRRSLTASTIQALVQPGTISLQVGSHAHEAHSIGLLDLSDQLTDFAETAALVASLNLVITVDTAIAHLAGALGVPVWVMLPAAPCWRWIAGRSDAPWYASMRLFQQQEPGDWAAVITEISALLAMEHPPAARTAYAALAAS